MSDELNRALSPIAALLIDLFARQMAMASMLRSQPGFDEASYREEIRKAHEKLATYRPLATARSQASAQRLEEIEKTLRGLL